MQILYIYVFSSRFYPKRFTVHSGYIFFVSMCSLGIEPTTFALLTQCSIAEPQEHIIGNYNYWFIEQNFNIGASLSNIYPVF